MTAATGTDASVQPQPAIRLEGVRKRFEGGAKALDDITLTIADRELLVLLGPSGCGKTTTLNIMAGLEEPTGGEVYFGTRLMNRVPPEERDVSMVFQSIALYPHMNVRQNIEFGLRHRRVPRPVIDERVSAITGLLGIEDYLGRRIHQLSGGQRQRVAIAKALVKRPRLFLLDEPFTALDADMRRQLRSELVRLHRELETTMLFVTHDQEEAMCVADRIAVLNEGSLVQIGSPLDVYFDPSTLWVARFVGTQPINLLDAEALPGGRLGLAGDAAMTVDAPERLHRAVAERAGRGGVVLGVRPELVGVRPAGGDGAGGGDGLEGRVFTRQVLGSSIVYDMRVGRDSHLQAVTASMLDLGAGAPVRLGFEWDRCLLFDRESGARIRPD